jgi:hypothetical protein
MQRLDAFLGGIPPIAVAAALAAGAALTSRAGHRRSWRRYAGAPAKLSAALAAILMGATMVDGGGVAHAAATTELVSLSADGSPIHNAVFDAISSDGRYVLFDSPRSDVVAGDTNRSTDVFVRDRLLGTTKRVSVGTGSFQLKGDSQGAAITPDGRYVLFTSNAGNLLPKKQRSRWYINVYVRDRVRGRTERVSIPQRNARFCFEAGLFDIVRASAWISANGRYVAFPGDHCNNGYTTGAFLRDRRLGITRELAKTHANAAPLGASPGLRYIAIGLDGVGAGSYRHLVVRDRVRSRNIHVEDALPAKKRSYDGLDQVFITRHAASIVFASKIAYKYDTATATAIPILDTSARQRFAIVEGISTDARYVAVVTNLYTAANSNDLYRLDTQSSDPPIQADLDSTGTPVENLWILGMGMSSDAHNIAFTGIYAGPKNGVYLRAGLP